jgi:hypothetical protein
MNSIVQWMIDRLKEASTWRGIIMLITGITGFTVDEQHTQAIIAAGIALVGMIGIFAKDKEAKVINIEVPTNDPMSRNERVSEGINDESI